MADKVSIYSTFHFSMFILLFPLNGIKVWLILYRKSYAYNVLHICSFSLLSYFLLYDVINFEMTCHFSSSKLYISQFYIPYKHVFGFFSLKSENIICSFLKYTLKVKIKDSPSMFV